MCVRVCMGAHMGTCLIVWVRARARVCLCIGSCPAVFKMTARGAHAHNTIFKTYGAAGWCGGGTQARPRAVAGRWGSVAAIVGRIESYLMNSGPVGCGGMQ